MNGLVACPRCEGEYIRAIPVVLVGHSPVLYIFCETGGHLPVTARLNFHEGQTWLQEVTL